MQAVIEVTFVIPIMMMTIIVHAVYEQGTHVVLLWAMSSENASIVENIDDNKDCKDIFSYVYVLHLLFDNT